MVMSKIHSFCDYHLTQHEDTLHLSLLWTASYKAKNWRNVTFKLAAILDLKVKTRSNCKTDIKNEFLDPKNPRNHILRSSFSQTIENYFSRWPTADILDFCQLRLMPTLLRATPPPVSFTDLQRRQKHYETNLRSPRSRKCVRWPNYNADDSLFKAILRNSYHVLYPYIPENQYKHYHLRQRPHNKALIPKTTYLSD